MRIEWLDTAILDLQRLKDFIQPYNKEAALRAVHFYDQTPSLWVVKEPVEAYQDGSRWFSILKKGFPFEEAFERNTIVPATLFLTAIHE